MLKWSGDGGAGGGAVAGGVLAEGFGPGAVAVGVICFAVEADVAAGGDLFSEAAQIGTEFVVAHNAEATVFEIGAETEGELFFQSGGEGERFDFPSELSFGFFAELDANSTGIKAGAME